MTGHQAGNGAFASASGTVDGNDGGTGHQGEVIDQTGGATAHGGGQQPRPLQPGQRLQAMGLHQLQVFHLQAPVLQVGEGQLLQLEAILHPRPGGGGGQGQGLGQGLGPLALQRR